VKRDTRNLTALCSGLFLYGLGWALAWSLADIRLPADLFPHAWFRRGSLGAVLSEAGAIALLLFALSLSWCYFSMRSAKLGQRPTTVWCLAGLGLAWFGGLLIGVLTLSDTPSAAEQSLALLLFSATQAPLWGLLNALALLTGALLAGAFAGRHYRQLGGGQGRPRTINSSYARRRKKSSRESVAASVEPGWVATRPLPELPPAAAGLHLPMGQTGR
jgi:hypothetical protein